MRFTFAGVTRTAWETDLRGIFRVALARLLGVDTAAVVVTGVEALRPPAAEEGSPQAEEGSPQGGPSSAAAGPPQDQPPAASPAASAAKEPAPAPAAARRRRMLQVRRRAPCVAPRCAGTSRRETVQGRVR